MPDVVLDSGILICLSDGDVAVRAFLQAAFEDERTSPRRLVPAVLVAEVVRGGARDATVNRFLKHAAIPAADLDAARVAGALLGRVGGSATVDALVVAVAAERPGAVVVTVDADDVPPLAEAAGVRVELLKS